MLVGIDPSETKEIDIEGVKFKIGIIPFQVMTRIKVKLVSVYSEDYSSVPDAIIEAVRYGVKGHSDAFKDRKGKPVPFVSEKDEYGVMRVSDKTLEWYSASQILEKLGSKVLEDEAARRR